MKASGYRTALIRVGHIPMSLLGAAGMVTNSVVIIAVAGDRVVIMRPSNTTLFVPPLPEER